MKMFHQDISKKPNFVKYPKMSPTFGLNSSQILSHWSLSSRIEAVAKRNDKHRASLKVRFWNVTSADGFGWENVVRAFASLTNWLTWERLWAERRKRTDTQIKSYWEKKYRKRERERANKIKNPWWKKKFIYLWQGKCIKTKKVLNWQPETVCFEVDNWRMIRIQVPDYTDVDKLFTYKRKQNVR